MRVYCDNIGYSDLITIGPNYYLVGIKLKIEDYPSTTIYNINEPNDSTKVHSKIQEAIDNIIVNGGGIVHIKEGTYVLMRNLLVQGNRTHLEGDGIDKTIIKLDDFAPSFIIGDSKRSGFIRSRATSDFIVSNMTIDGNKNYQYYDDDSVYGRYGLFTEGCTNIWFDNVKVINFQGYGFDPHGWKTANILGKYLTISNCIAENNNYDGFTIDQTYYAYIVNCISNNNGRHGYNIVTGAKFINLTNNIATHNGFYDPYGGSGCGYMVQNNQLFGTSDVTMNNNSAFHSKKSSLCLNDVYNVTFAENYINDSNYCFHFVKTRSSIIFNNICYAKKLLSSTDTTIIYNSGLHPHVYIYNNTYTRSLPTGRLTDDTSSPCTYRHMRCLSDYTYQTCNIDESENTYWGNQQDCATGLSCHQVDNYIYCY